MHWNRWTESRTMIEGGAGDLGLLAALHQLQTFDRGAEDVWEPGQLRVDVAHVENQAPAIQLQDAHPAVGCRGALQLAEDRLALLQLGGGQVQIDGQPQHRAGQPRIGAQLAQLGERSHGALGPGPVRHALRSERHLARAADEHRDHVPCARLAEIRRLRCAGIDHGRASAGRHVAEAVGVTDRQVVEPALARRVLGDRKVRLAIHRIERAAVHEADADALVTGRPLRQRQRRVILSSARATGPRMEHGDIVQCERVLVLIDDVRPRREGPAERMVRVVHGAWLQGIVVARQEEDGAATAHRTELAGDRLPPRAIRTRLVEEITRAQDRIDAMLVGGEEDLVEHVEARACQRGSIALVEAREPASEVPVGSVE
jgi:hypothetical protein